MRIDWSDQTQNRFHTRICLIQGRQRKVKIQEMCSIVSTYLATNKFNNSNQSMIGGNISKVMNWIKLIKLLKSSKEMRQIMIQRMPLWAVIVTHLKITLTRKKCTRMYMVSKILKNFSSPGKWKRRSSLPRLKWNNKHKPISFPTWCPRRKRYKKMRRKASSQD